MVRFEVSRREMPGRLIRSTILSSFAITHFRYADDIAITKRRNKIIAFITMVMSHGSAGRILAF